jgi:protoporphyrinogen oxidase
LKNKQIFILGAGITGLAVGWASGWPIYEAEDIPGGICSSYYVKPDTKERLKSMPRDGEAYRFEVGGGHWIFGARKEVLKFIKKFSLPKNYARSSAVYFSKAQAYIPYPLQNNLRFFAKELRNKVLKEISQSTIHNPAIMEKWLTKYFGPTLCKLFFYPFHDLYTAGLYQAIAPQDVHKSPVNLTQMRQGAQREVKPVGYNITFVYPSAGLDVFCKRLASQCIVHYKKKVVKIDPKNKRLFFTDKSSFSYAKLISTFPLNKMLELANLKTKAKPDSYTSVLVLNIGALRGEHCPQEHWLYIPDSVSGFHRVGFYSNVDVSFLPRAAQKDNSRVSIYVERAYLGGEKPSSAEIKRYSESVVKELQRWSFIKGIEVIDPTWIDVAYTWSWPASQWREESLRLLESHDIYQLGRYGRWKFQGIAESIKEGLSQII